MLNGLINLLQAMLDFESDIENLKGKIKTLNIAIVCLGFEIYDVRLPDIFL